MLGLEVRIADFFDSWYSLEWFDIFVFGFLVSCVESISLVSVHAFEVVRWCF